MESFGTLSTPAKKARRGRGRPPKKPELPVLDHLVDYHYVVWKVVHLAKERNMHIVDLEVIDMMVYGLVEEMTRVIEKSIFARVRRVALYRSPLPPVTRLSDLCQMQNVNDECKLAVKYAEIWEKDLLHTLDTEERLKMEKAWEHLNSVITIETVDTSHFGTTFVGRAKAPQTSLIPSLALAKRVYPVYLDHSYSQRCIRKEQVLLQYIQTIPSNRDVSLKDLINVVDQEPSNSLLVEKVFLRKQAKDSRQGTSQAWH